MDTFQPISGNPVKNNTGAVISGGSNTTLASTKLINNPTHGPKTDMQILGVGSVNTVDGTHLGRDPYRKMYRTLVKNYGLAPSGLNLFTGLSTNTATYNVFTLNSSGLTNENNNYIYTYGKKPTNTVVPSYVNPVVKDYSLNLINGSARVYMKDYALGLSLFTGSINPSGNETHTKTIAVQSQINGITVLNKTYEIDAWSKLNLNFIAPITSVDITVTGDPTNTVYLGKTTQFTQSTSVSRTGITVTAPISNPVIYNGSTNLTLTNSENSFKYTATDDMLLVISEIDPNGTPSPNVYNIVPSGATFEYYPAYKNLGIATCIPTDYSLDSRPLTVSTYT